MATEPQGGPAAGEEAGEVAEVVAPEPTETSGGAPSADDAEAQAQAARDEWIAGLVAKGVEQALSRFQPQAREAPAAPPPTAGRGVVAELEAERDHIAAEMRRVEENVRKDGLTAQNIYDRQTVFDQKSEWLAKVQLEATRQGEAERQLSTAGSEEEWRRYAASYPPGTDISLMRKAFLHDQAAARAAAEANKPKPRFTPGSDRRVVDVSGPSEVSAGERKARTMTEAQINAHKDSLRGSGKREELIEFERSIRNGQVIRK